MAVVVGPDKEPVSGAKLYATVSHGFRREPFPAAERAMTAADGHFEFTVPKSASDDDKPVVAAMCRTTGSPGRTFRLMSVDEITLQLVRDLPLNGEIIDLEKESRSTAALLRVLEINTAPSRDLGFWLKSLDLKELNAPFEKDDDVRDGIDVSGLDLTATTDAEGRFKLSGVGHKRTVSNADRRARYRQSVPRGGHAAGGSDRREIPCKRGSITYFGSYFRYVAAPTKPVMGVVRDKDTRQPIAGVTVESNQLANDPVPGRNIVQTMTDAEGRYRLTGLPKGSGNKIRLVPRDDQPYVSVHSLVPDTPGLAAVTVDFELKGGIWIEGKVTRTHRCAGARIRRLFRARQESQHSRPPRIRWHSSADLGSDDEGRRLVPRRRPPWTGPDRRLLHGPTPAGAPPRRRVRIDGAIHRCSPPRLGLLLNYTALSRIDPAVGA